MDLSRAWPPRRWEPRPWCPSPNSFRAAWRLSAREEAPENFQIYIMKTMHREVGGGLVPQLLDGEAGSDCDAYQSGALGGFNPYKRIFKGHAIFWFETQMVCGLQVDFRVGFGAGDFIPAHQGMEIFAKPERVDHEIHILAHCR